MTAVLPARPLRQSPTLRPVAASQVPIRPARLALRLSRWTLRRLVDLGLFTAVVAFLALAVGPHTLDYRTVTMLTSSMSPGIDPGDVVVDTALPVADIEPGMVLTHHIPVGDQRVVSHRVVTARTAADGSVTVQTKGDANTSADPWTATFAADGTAWQVRAVVPAVGEAIRLLRTPALSQALVWGAPTLLAGWVLLTVWRPTRTDDDGGTPA